MEIIEQKENFLTNRKEVKVIVDASKNPTYEEAGKIIAEEFKAETDLIIIKEIKGKFGRNTFLISAFIYNSKEDKENFEVKKNEKKKEETPAAQPPQTPADNTPAEQKPEEKPAEEKKETDNVPTQETQEEKKQEKSKED